MHVTLTGTRLPACHEFMKSQSVPEAVKGVCLPVIAPLSGPSLPHCLSVIAPLSGPSLRVGIGGDGEDNITNEGGKCNNHRVTYIYGMKNS